MKTQTALVRADSVVKLNAIAFVDLGVSQVVSPSNTEDDLSVRLGQSFKNSVFFVEFFVLFYRRAEGRKDFFNRLQKLRLIFFRFYIF